MTSYKDKINSLLIRMNMVEQRVLLDESVILGLKSRIEELTAEVERLGKNDDSSALMLNQIGLALYEIDKQFNPNASVSHELSSLSGSDALAKIGQKLNKILSHVNETKVRGKTIADSLDNVLHRARERSSSKEHRSHEKPSRRSESTSSTQRLHHSVEPRIEHRSDHKFDSKDKTLSPKR
ncbi:hypothetical protein [Botrytis cinerea negative-stranded RNA virus 4]|uniref:Uncharacterized protein n=1 Tax=Botrytis cinerea negative-stranded RNA virus 4 TaxID=2735939 RepID=A0AAE7AJZ1_9MONO|nr:hypothetical protein QKS22_gp1 [Botrytis cinerea negative-stranded RNA virus 4]QJT73699.1 hypothetical protein [Botrytis cinerea negative-stranded RNA virus 4]